MTTPVRDISIQQLRQVTYELPSRFQIRLNARQVQCHRLLRSVPGKRLVFLGRFADEVAIVKLFIHPSRAKTHWSRELNGAVLLQDKHILTPALIDSGLSGEGVFVLIFRYIAGRDLASLWKKSGVKERERRLSDMMPLLAKHHDARLTHQDLHYGNFLVAANGQIYTLDAEEIQSSSTPLKKARRLKNLALFLAQTFDMTEAVNVSLLDQYADVSAIKLKPEDPNRFVRWITGYRQQRIDQYLKKIQRECTEIIHGSTKRGYTLCRRERHSLEVQKLLEQPESFFQSDGSVYLKQGNTCTVKSVEVAGKRLVMKRYNPKGVMYELAHKGKISRARKSWINAHLLRFVGIRTPEPIALIEHQPALGERCSYFVSEKIEGQNSWDFFCDNSSPDEFKRRVAFELVDTLKQLYGHRISHGDLKGSNFLIERDKVWVLDLDALVQHKRNRAFAASWKRDRKRFFKNWDEKSCYAPWKRYFCEKFLEYPPGGA